MKKLSTLALPLAAATAVVPVITAAPAQAAGSERTISAYTTGYSWYDNTPVGSSQIANPVIHDVAGGKGTYSDPITVAVGSNGEIAYGTRFYVPVLHRYFIAEDHGGSQLNSPRGGADVWLDLWVGGSGVSESSVNNCMNSFTGVHTVIQNPSSGYPVSSGSIAGNCDTFSDSAPSSSSSSDSSDDEATALSSESKISSTKSTSTKSTSSSDESDKAEATSSDESDSKDAAEAKKSTPKATAAPKAAAVASVAKKAVAYTPKRVAAAPAAKEAEHEVYTVKAGDTLFNIAREHGIVSWQKIFELNDDKIDDPNLIYVGQRFILN